MLKGNWGRAILTFVLIATFAVSDAVDWNETHLFNPSWTPHAKFHDVAMLHLLTGVCLMALWLLWRRSLEPLVAAKVAFLIPVIFWAAFFYATWLVPGTSLKAMPDEELPAIAGFELYPNWIIAAVNVILATVGYLIRRREHQTEISASGI